MFIQSKSSDDWGNDSNEELWSSLQKGNRKALSELFVRFYSRLFRYGHTLIPDSEAVKDGIQELFLSLWRHRQGLREAVSVEFYLLISFKRILFKEKKSDLTRRKRNFEYDEHFFETDFSVENRIIDKEREEERYKLYQKALLTLSDRQREILRLRMEYGLDNPEIAELTGLSEKRVRNLIYEATKRLKGFVDRFESLQVNNN